MLKNRVGGYFFLIMVAVDIAPVVKANISKSKRVMIAPFRADAAQSLF